MRYYLFSVFVMGYLSLATPAQAEKIIRWVDHKGVTHFSDTPPTGKTSVEEVHLKPINKADVPTAALSPDLKAASAAIRQNKSPGTKSGIVIKGARKKTLTPMARPSSKRVDSRYRGRVR